MSDIKNLKSLNLSSVTIIGTAIHVVLAIILSIITLLVIGSTVPNGITVIGIIIPSVILAVFTYSVYSLFTKSYLYNWLAKRMNNINFQFKDSNTISKISTTSTALIVAIISTIMSIIVLIIAMTLLPLILSSAIQTLIFTGQINIANSLYQIILTITNPIFIILLLISIFILSFIYTLIGTFIFNLIGNRIPIVLELSQIEGITTVEKLNIKSFAFVFSIISLILNLITGIINAISYGDYVSIVIFAVVGFIYGFIITAIAAYLYNILSPRLGKIKCELIN